MSCVKGCYWQTISRFITNSKDLFYENSVKIRCLKPPFKYNHFSENHARVFFFVLVLLEIYKKYDVCADE